MTALDKDFADLVKETDHSRMISRAGDVERIRKVLIAVLGFDSRDGCLDLRSNRLTVPEVGIGFDSINPGLVEIDPSLHRLCSQLLDDVSVNGEEVVDRLGRKLVFLCQRRESRHVLIAEGDALRGLERLGVERAGLRRLFPSASALARPASAQPARQGRREALARALAAPQA
jgi:hypothetical protein